MIRVNGEEKEIDTSKSLEVFLKEEGYDIDKIAVELNENIVKKSLYSETLLGDGDALEVVRFVGGG